MKHLKIDQKSIENGIREKRKRSERKNFTFRLPVVLMEELKEYCAKKEYDRTEVIEELLEKLLYGKNS